MVRYLAILTGGFLTTGCQDRTFKHGDAISVSTIAAPSTALRLTDTPKIDAAQVESDAQAQKTRSQC